MEKTLEQLEKDVIDMIRTCYDPEIPVNIYELGLIYEVNINEANDVHEKIRTVEGVNSAKVEITFEPTWDQSMMSEEAKLELGFL